MADLIKDYIENALSGAKTESGCVTLKAEGAVHKLTGLIAAYLAQGSNILVVADDNTLSEIYGSIPENIKSAIDYKSGESKSLSHAPAEIKEQEALKRALRDRINALKDLAIYAEIVNGDDIAGKSYYDALEYVLGGKFKAVEFAEPAKVGQVTADGYSELVKAVENAAEYYEVMAHNGDITLCPWFGIKHTSQRDKMLAGYSDIKKVMLSVLEDLKNAPDTLTLVNVLAALADNVLEKDEMKNLLGLKRMPCDFRRLEQLINDFNSVYFGESSKFDMTASENEPAFDKLAACKVDESLTYKKLTQVCQNSDIFVRCGRYVESLPFERLVEIRHKIAELKAEQSEYMRDTLVVLDKLKDDDGDMLLKAYDRLYAYRSGVKSKPALFDFGAKSLHKKLCTLSSGSPSFEDALNAVCSYSAATACGEEISKLKTYISRMVGRELAQNEFDSLDIVVGQYEKNNLNGQSVSGYLIEAQRAATLIRTCLKERECPEDFTLSDFIKAYKLHIRRMALGNTVDGILAAAKIEYNGRELQTLACSLALVMRTAELFGSPEAVIDFMQSVRNSDKPFMNDLMSVVNELIRFGRTYFQGYYTRNPFALTLGDLKRFVKIVDDESILDAALGYCEILKKTRLLPLDKFFEHFERGEITANKKEMTEIFRKSFFALAAENKRISLGKRRSGLGKYAQVALEKYLAAEDTLKDAFFKAACGKCRLGTEEDGAGKYDLVIKVGAPAKKKVVCGKNFLGSVAEFIADNGISKECVAINYRAEGVNVPVAVLSADLKKPALYISCEMPYEDVALMCEEAARMQSLSDSVPVHRIFIHEWTDGEKAEKTRLLKSIENLK